MAKVLLEWGATGYDENLLGDAYEYEDDKRFEVDPDLVISRNTDYSPKSYFKDERWDVGTLIGRAKFELKFDFDYHGRSVKDDAMNAQLKEIAFALVSFHVPKLSAVTVRSSIQYWRIYMRAAKMNDCDLSNWWDNSSAWNSLISTLNNKTDSYKSQVFSVIKQLMVVASEYPYFNKYIPSQKKLFELKNFVGRVDASQSSNNQTPIIPTRIYAALFSHYDKAIPELDAAVSLLEKHIYNVQSDPTFYKQPKTSADIKRADNPEYRGKYKWACLRLWDDSGLERLETLIGGFRIKDGGHVRDYSIDYAHLKTKLFDVQRYLKFGLHLMTGARDAELRNCPYDCIEEVSLPDGTRSSFLTTYTFKFNDGVAQESKWVAPLFSGTLVNLLQRISTLRVKMTETISSDFNSVHKKPLFAGLVRIDKHPFFDWSPAGKPNATFENCFSNLPFCKELLDNLVIQEMDVIELEKFDLERPWRAQDEFKIGSMWQLATHQARRSLVVYAARSGLVTIGTLQFQLKHITVAMTEYYANGAGFFECFIRGKNESIENMVEEFNDELATAAFMRYEKHVLDTEYRLSGGEGTRLQNLKDKSDTRIPILDRDETKKAFKKGLKAAKEGVFGICHNPNSCQKVAFTSLASCSGCAHSSIEENDGTASNLSMAIEELLVEIDAYGVNTPFGKGLVSDATKLIGDLSRLNTSLSDKYMGELNGK